MGKVINLFSNEEDLKHCSYFTDEFDALGLAMKDGSLSIRPLNSKTIEVSFCDNFRVFERSEIAEFLKVAAIFVDSEDRYLPELDLIGMNYDVE